MLIQCTAGDKYLTGIFNDPIQGRKISLHRFCEEHKLTFDHPLDTNFLRLTKVLQEHTITISFNYFSAAVRC